MLKTMAACFWSFSSCVPPTPRSQGSALLLLLLQLSFSISVLFFNVAGSLYHLEGTAASIFPKSTATPLHGYLFSDSFNFKVIFNYIHVFKLFRSGVSFRFILNKHFILILTNF